MELSGGERKKMRRLSEEVRDSLEFCELGIGASGESCRGGGQGRRSGLVANRSLFLFSFSFAIGQPPGPGLAASQSASGRCLTEPKYET